MIRSTGRITLCVVLFALLGAMAAWGAVPRLVGRVNDYAKLLDEQQKSLLEQALARFEAQTTTQIVLLTTPSLEGRDITSYSIEVADQWKIGQAGKDNGVMLVVAPQERKVRIEVGYGLEGALTDAEASRIIRHVIVPSFKEGNYFAGIAGGLDGIMKASQGEFIAPAAKVGYRSYEGTKKPSILSTILMAVIFLVLISTRTGRSLLFWTLMFGGFRGGGFRGGGGGFSGGGGGFGGGGASGGW